MMLYVQFVLRCYKQDNKLEVMQYSAVEKSWFVSAAVQSL
jgi:hypothetical protein